MIIVVEETLRTGILVILNPYTPGSISDSKASSKTVHIFLITYYFKNVIYKLALQVRSLNTNKSLTFALNCLKTA